MYSWSVFIIVAHVVLCSLTSGDALFSIPPAEFDYDDDALENETKEARREYVRTKLLPSQRFCGQQHTDDRVYDGNETALDEFPWIAYLNSVTHIDKLYRCNGVLISNRYVLTSAWCGNSKEIKVVLGQYTTAKNVACIHESSLLECTEPVIIRGVEKLITNDGSETPTIYTYTSYNLMLLRLNESVQFSDYIRPICLPIDGSKRPASENYLTFSSLGADAYDESEVIKKKIIYNLTSLQVCYDLQENLEYQIDPTSGATLACLVPPPGNTINACMGDCGAPLMYKYKYKWFVDALFVDVMYTHEFVPYNLDYLTTCNATAPISGINLTPTVINWILDNIQD